MCSSKPLQTQSELGSATLYFMENNNVAKLATGVKHTAARLRVTCVHCENVTFWVVCTSQALAVAVLGSLKNVNFFPPSFL